MYNEYDVGCPVKKYLKEYREILSRMIKEISEAELNDSISHNFIIQMIPHHRAAIEMSENILRYTKNNELIEIAENIISEQTKSIENMQEIQSSCGKHINTCCKVKEYQCKVKEYQCKVNQIMKIMFSDMSTAYSDNRINCDFIREMIPHHIGAIRMSKNALEYDICFELKPILNAIISSQESGVCQMRNLFKKLKCRH